MFPIRDRGIDLASIMNAGGWKTPTMVARNIERRAAKAALMPEDLLSVMQALPGSLQGIRDRALLLLTYGAALRRSEAVGIEVDSIVFSAEGQYNRPIHWPVGSQASAADSGNTTEKREPRLGRESTETVWSSMRASRLTMARPNPRPLRRSRSWLPT